MTLRLFLAPPPLGVPPLSPAAAAAWAALAELVPESARAPSYGEAQAVIVPAAWAARYLPGRQRLALNAPPPACLVLTDPAAPDLAREVWRWMARGADQCWLAVPPWPVLMGLIDHLSTPVLAEGRLDVPYIDARVADSASAFLGAELAPGRRLLTTAMLHALSTRDGYTAGHRRRVGWLSCLMGVSLGYPRRALERLTLAATLHDVGKLGIADAILRSTQRLTDGERAEIETHPQLGADLVQRHEALYDLGPAVLEHHEAWNGEGYPFRKAGESVTRDARIIGIVDAFDAITRDRPYRAGRPVSVAVAELHRVRGTQCDPVLVDVFLALIAAGVVPPEPRRLARLVEDVWNSAVI